MSLLCRASDGRCFPAEKVSCSPGGRNSSRASGFKVIHDVAQRRERDVTVEGLTKRMDASLHLRT